MDTSIDPVGDASKSENNLIGALIFWPYIFFALTFTGLVLDSIFRLPAARPSRQNQVMLFSFLAVFSFTALSSNMLHVLFHSFESWKKHHTVPHQLNASSILSTIWHWSVTSTLFKDFGIAIFANLGRCLWTQAALWTTMSVCLYMSAEGKRRRVPRLWAYFALSQILPISFAQNLFYVALLKVPSTGNSSVIKLPKILTTGIVLAYGSCLVLAISPVAWKALDRETAHRRPIEHRNPFQENTIATILAARLLLVLPFFLPNVKAGKETSHRRSDLQRTQLYVAICAAVMTFGMLLLLCDLHSTGIYGKIVTFGHFQAALWSHPAVASLGFDFIISTTSAMIWIFDDWSHDEVD